VFNKLLLLALIEQVINVRDKELLKKFGQHLRDLRVAAGFTQEGLANEADIPINQIGRIERGEINPTLSTLYAIGKGLNKPLPDLLNF
jgi:transcriptional regulator with XRE-family HTH domain